MVRLSRVTAMLAIVAALSLGIPASLWAQTEIEYVEQDLLTVEEPFVSLREKLPVREGDGEIAVQIEARINPDTDLEAQPGGWWYYLEFEGEAGRYLTGLYKSPALTEETQRFPEVKSYIPTGTQAIRVGVGAEGKTYQQVTSLRVLRRSSKVSPNTPADGSSIADNTPRFAWDTAAQRVTVEVSHDPAFPREDTERVAVQMRREVQFPQALAPGTWYWRLVTMDGVASAPVKFEQTAPVDADTTGPELDVGHQYIAQAQGPLVAKVRDGSTVTRVTFQANEAPAAPVQVVDGRASWTPPGGWQPGLTRVTVRVEDEHGNASGKLVYVSHAETPPSAITWTSHRGVQIEGQEQPFFPLAMYMVRDFEMPKVKAAGFNMVQHYGADGSDNGTTSAWLKAAEENDLRAFVAFDRTKLANVDMDFVAERVATLFSEPALMAWYLFDEPELPSHGVHPYKLKAIADLIRALDPFHPILMALYHEHFIPEYRHCFDAHLTQAYHKDPGGVRREALFAGGLLKEHGRAGSLIVHNYIPFASFESNRCNAFLAAMYQSGVFWWGWWDDYIMGRFATQGRGFQKRFEGLENREQQRAAFEKELTAIASELRELEPVFTGPGPRRVWEQGGVSFWLKEQGDVAWLIVANVSDVELWTTTHPLPELRGIPSMQVRGETETLTVEAGRVSLRLRPHEVVVCSGRR